MSSSIYICEITLGQLPNVTDMNGTPNVKFIPDVWGFCRGHSTKTVPRKIGHYRPNIPKRTSRSQVSEGGSARSPPSPAQTCKLGDGEVTYRRPSYHASIHGIYCVGVWLW